MKDLIMTHFNFVRPDEFIAKSALGRLRIKNTVAEYRARWQASAEREIEEPVGMGDEDLERARLGERSRQLADKADAVYYIRRCAEWEALAAAHANPAEDAEIEALFGT